MTKTNNLINIPVLIVGAGPVGLSMALALARQNIPSIVIERNPGLTEHPRARGVSVRTMELFHQWENAQELLRHEHPKEALRFIWARSLQGEEITRITGDAPVRKDLSFTSYSFVTQDHVEQSLYHTLENYPETKIYFLKEMQSFVQDENGVTVEILNLRNNQKEIIHAQYVIAADGAKSRIRQQLGIVMNGPADLGRFCNVLCEMDLSAWTSHRLAAGYFFADPERLGRNLFSVDGIKRWIFGMRYSPENTKQDFSDEYCLAEIRRVFNLDDRPVKIINKSFWTMAAQIAEKYREKRILLVGDAAHRIPPTGGLGMNTGVQDAHNLAWKLAHVLKYKASDTLLDSYEEERMPVCKRNIAWSQENATRYLEIGDAILTNNMPKLTEKLHEQNKNLNFIGLDLGFIYHSNIIAVENEQTLSVSPAEYVPTTLPGSRAPHVLLEKGGETFSSLKLFEKDFTLLIGAKGQDWQNAVDELKQAHAYLPLQCFRIASDGDLLDPGHDWQEKYEVTANGAVLVRPDGHVAWRNKVIVSNPKEILMQALMYT